MGQWVMNNQPILALCNVTAPRYDSHVTGDSQKNQSHKLIIEGVLTTEEMASG